METSRFDVVVIGAGMAGATAAAQLAPTHRVALLERESHPGYHSTGRSAALFSEIYGSEPVRLLSRASRDFLFAPPAGFSDYPLATPRGALHIARADQMAEVDAFLAMPGVEGSAQLVDAAEVERRSPLVRQGYAVAGVYEPDARDVDVHALHQGYLRQVKAAGGVLMTDAACLGLERGAGGWRIRTQHGVVEAPVVVDAGGAWADEVAGLAGLAPLGITPCRRTALLVDAPAGPNIAGSPLTIDIEETFYFKPDAGLLLVSPCDETPSPPCDAQPDEMDVAIAVDKLQSATTIEVSRVRRKWAGLRSFAPDRNLVVGFDARAEGFFWLAGQGGYGIQTA
ncbi:MAG TPA: FAD-dependent oxidoreductase, partial [Rhizomicrobium sp.]|nr:FAD-dependent oxidoreductase [Rhizomicrobium sp.]